MKRISIVVPVYNEEENIEHFAQSVAEVMGALPYAYEWELRYKVHDFMSIAGLVDCHDTWLRLIGNF